MKKNNLQKTMMGAGMLAAVLTPTCGWACACGCGMFEVGTSAMFPTEQGGMAYLEYDYQDQNRNWSGMSKASPDDNGDKEIRTDFITLGLQYMFTRSWGAQIEVPYDYRYFNGTDENNVVRSRNWNQLGDVRLEGIYTGFSPDLSAGLTFGLKLPTGSHSFDPGLVDRDTQIGTGSTDLLLGGFYRGNIAVAREFEWFAQAQLDLPMFEQNSYRPGIELDAAAGIDYRGLAIGPVHIAPIAQIIFSDRVSDSGANANPENTGYQRILLSPGIEFNIHPFRIYADAEFPVLQNFTGDQLSAPVAFKCSVSYMF